MQNYWENFTVLDLIFPHNSLSAFPKTVLFHKNTFLLGGKSRLGVSAGQIRGSGIWGILRGGSSSSPSYKVGRRRSKLLRIAGYQRLKLSTNSKSRFRVCKIILIPRNLQLKKKKKMALRIHPFSPKPVPCFSRFPANHCHQPIHLIAVSPRLRISISCSSSSSKSNRLGDSQLASELATEVRKISAQILEREQALYKSKELLFKELCNYVGVADEEVKKRWMQMSEDDKWVLVKNFVSDWGSNFHPLSAKSVKELVDEYLVKMVKDKDMNVHGGSATANATSTMLFPSLRRLIGFSQNNN